VHLNLNLAYADADATDDFMQTLKTTPFDAIDVALVRLELFTDRENRNSSVKDTQLKFIHTNNRIELTSVIKKPKSEMSIAACDNALKKLKSAYKNTALTKIAFPDYSSDDQKLAVKIFNYQALLVDKIQPSTVFACN
jgi:DNA primase catalytic subunit